MLQFLASHIIVHLLPLGFGLLVTQNKMSKDISKQLRVAALCQVKLKAGTCGCCGALFMFQLLMHHLNV